MSASDLAFAQQLADAADAITLARFRASDLHVETKPDLTPVSEADRAAEETIRALVASSGRGEAVLGESFALRATVAYKGAWVRLTRTFCETTAVKAASARFAQAVAQLPSERAFAGFASCACSVPRPTSRDIISSRPE